MKTLLINLSLTLIISIIPSISLAGITTNVTGEPYVSPPSQPIWGWADMHAHQFSNLAFGGKLISGRPAGNANVSLGADTEENAHGALGPLHGYLDPIGNYMRSEHGDLDLNHEQDGYPTFNSWPKWNTFTHQAIFHKWLERAWRSGQRIMTSMVVNNEVFCKVQSTTHLDHNHNCSDMPSVDTQIQATKNMQTYIDNLAGGAGKGWYRIAYTPEEARDIIADGKLAVIIGVEVSALFGCKENNTSCTKSHVKQQIDKYYDLGVRHVFPVHVFDNAFGGAAVFNPLFTIGNQMVNGQLTQLRECNGDVGYNAKLNGNGGASVLLGAIMSWDTSYIDSLPGDNHCNKKGMTTLGMYAVNELMNKGMIIDVDHISDLGLIDVMSLAKQREYPVVSGHRVPRQVLRQSKRAESYPTDQLIKDIRDLGGMVGIILSSKRTNEFRYINKTVPLNCDMSVQGFAQAYLYTQSIMSGNNQVLNGVAFGTDINGFIPMPGPRFGSEACFNNTNQQGLQGKGISYPFEAHGQPGVIIDRQKNQWTEMVTDTGDWWDPFDDKEVPVKRERSWNYNNEGVAHYGLIPDMIEDLKVMGVSDNDLAPLFHSAEKYVQVWEKSIKYSVIQPDIQANINVNPNALGWYNKHVTVSLNATGSANAGLGIRLRADGTEIIDEIFYPQSQLDIDITKEGSTQLYFNAEYDMKNTRKSQTDFLNFNLDLSLPVITATMTPLANNNGWHHSPVDIELLCIDTLSGVAGYTSSKAISAEGAGQSIQASCSDNAGNIATKLIDQINIDMTAPVLSVTVSPQANSNGWYNEPVNIEILCEDSLSGTLAYNSTKVIKSEAENQSIELTCTDNAGNITNKVIDQINIDMTAPVITLVGDSHVTLMTSDEYNELGAIVTDNLSSDLSSSIQIESNIETGVAGDYKVVYSVVDLAMNRSEVSRTVTINDMNTSLPEEDVVIDNAAAEDTSEEGGNTSESSSGSGAFGFEIVALFSLIFILSLVRRTEKSV